MSISGRTCTRCTVPVPMGIAALGGSIHPVWTDRRTSVAALDEEVFTATIKAR